MSDGPFRPLGAEPDEDGGRAPGEHGGRAPEGDGGGAPEGDGGGAPPRAGATGPRPGPPRPAVRSSPVTWILGVAAVLAIAYITLNTIATESPGSRGVAEGDPLPPFAAPLVIGGPEGDAQVDPAVACSVRAPDVLNSCELRGRPVAIAFLASRSERCDEQLDVLERTAAGFPDVQLAAVYIRGTREEAAAAVRRRGWDLPVAWDRDGAVANLFAVAVCPTITFAGSDGRVAGTTLGFATQAEITERLRALDREAGA